MTARDSGAAAAPALPFGLYAGIYDLLYADKDYAAEAAFVAALLRRFLDPPPAQPRVADLACGTGRHAFEMTRLGFRMTGSDASPAMIEAARASAARQGLPVPFHAEPFQSCQRIGGTYDAALALFASLGYLSAPQDFAATLAGVRQLLEPGGLFLFDVWNGPAVVRDYSPLRVKQASGPGASVTRTSHTTLDEDRRIAAVRFDFVVRPRGGDPVEFSEEHRVRFFFPEEVVDTLQAGGFEVVLQCPFLEPSRALGARDWNAAYVARRR